MWVLIPCMQSILRSISDTSIKRSYKFEFYLLHTVIYNRNFKWSIILINNISIIININDIIDYVHLMLMIVVYWFGFLNSQALVLLYGRRYSLKYLLILTVLLTV